MTFKLLKPIPILIRVWTNKMEVARLDTEKSLNRTATYEFSNARIVLAEPIEAKFLLIEMLKELVESKWGFSKSIVVAIQQMERTEGGLSHVEARGLIDLCEMVGASQVIFFDETENVTHQRAMDELSRL